MGFVAFIETENFDVMANPARLSGGSRRLFDVETRRCIFGPLHAERETRFPVCSFQIGLRHSTQPSLTIVSSY